MCHLRAADHAYILESKNHCLHCGKFTKKKTNHLELSVGSGHTVKSLQRKLEKEFI